MCIRDSTSECGLTLDPMHLPEVCLQANTYPDISKLFTAVGAMTRESIAVSHALGVACYQKCINTLR